MFQNKKEIEERIKKQRVPAGRRILYIFFFLTGRSNNLN